MKESLHSLTDQLQSLHLVPPGPLQMQLARLDKQAGSQELLQALERADLLTGFQVEKIQKGQIDQLVVGGCKLMYQNAAGSFARLYRASRLSDGQMIGIKILRERWSKDPGAIQLFHREGQLGQKLKHPNIVPIFEVGTFGKFHYITMEFVEGGNLRDFLKIRGRLSPLEALQYTLHISRALEAALALGLTHRDMKTTNVLMSSQGVAKLIDFGLATEDHPPGAQAKGDLAQALEYSTLERNTGAPRNDPRSDLFFLGTILYELLTGEAPYPRTKDRDERKTFSRYRDIRPITSIDSKLPDEAVQIVERLLQVNPVRRYQTPGELNGTLEQSLRKLGQPAALSAAVPDALAGEAKVVIFVENRPGRQDVLRKYFSQRGFRVVLLADADRALARLKTMAPYGIVFFGDELGERICGDVQQALKLSAGQSVAVAAVLSDSQEKLKQQLATAAPQAILLTQPVNLRSLRQAIEAAHGDQKPAK